MITFSVKNFDLAVPLSLATATWMAMVPVSEVIREIVLKKQKKNAKLVFFLQN